LSFFKEYSSGAYGALSYFIAKILAELPFNLFMPLLYSIIVYFMVGLRTDDDGYHFFIFYVALLLVSQNSIALGLMISTGISNINLALVIAPLCFLPMMLFGGFFANLSSIPDFLNWLQYLSILKYAFEILVVNEFDGLTFTCRIASVHQSGHGHHNSQPISPQRCLSKGSDVISLLSMENVSIDENIGILIAFFCGMQILAFLFLKLVLVRQ